MGTDTRGGGPAVADLLTWPDAVDVPLGTLHALAGVRPVRLAIALMVSPELTTTQ